MTTPARHAPAAKTRWTPGATFWFAAMVGAWLAFFGLLLFSEPTLGELRRDVRDLPLLVEGAVWLAMFPLVLALGVWDGGLAEWLRFALVCLFAVAWSAAFFPHRRS
jgi:hypothetical protein